MIANSGQNGRQLVTQTHDSGSTRPIELRTGIVKRWEVGVIGQLNQLESLHQAQDKLIRAGWSNFRSFVETGEYGPIHSREAGFRTGQHVLPPVVRWALALEALVLDAPDADAYLITFASLELPVGLKSYLEASLWPGRRMGAVALSGTCPRLPHNTIGFYEQTAAQIAETPWGAAAHIIPGAVASAFAERAVNDVGDKTLPMEGVDDFVRRLCTELELPFVRHAPALSWLTENEETHEEEAAVGNGKPVDKERVAVSVGQLLKTVSRKRDEKPASPRPWFHNPLPTERLTLGMIVLNEEQYLEANLRQHYDWADEILIVEGADRDFPSAHVSPEGLSIDRTAEVICDFPDPDHKIQFIRYGWAKGKRVIRDQYCRFAQNGLLLVVDADEFWLHEDQQALLEMAARARPELSCFGFPFVHFWKDTEHVVKGGMFDVMHWRLYRFEQGFRYSENHNYLCNTQGEELHRSRGTLLSREWGMHCYHFGHAKRLQDTRAKTDYYRARGECKSRPHNIACRESWFSGDLPDGVRVEPYHGPIPMALNTTGAI